MGVGLMIISLIFIALTILTLINLLLFKKSHLKKDFFIWFPVNLSLILFILGGFCAILSLFHIPINHLSISILLIALNILMIVLNKIRGLQKYKFNKKNLVLVLLIICLCIFIGLIRFGTDLVPSFISVDGATHLGFANNVLDHATVKTNMMMTSAIEGLFMGAFSVLFDSFYSYKIYLVFELLFYLLSALMFLSVALFFEKKCTRLGFVAILLFTVFYSLGYPLYSFEFGFSYLGFSIIAVANILFLLLNVWKNKLNNSWIIFLALSLLSLGLSYTIFVPEVFLASFIVLLIIYRSKNKFALSNFIIVCCKVFIVPSLIVILMSIMFGSEFSAVGGSSQPLNTDGGCFNDLYSSFILLFPLSLYAIIESIKKIKSISVVSIFAVVSVLFSLCLVVMLLTNRISIYYCVKNSNILWLEFCLLNVYALIILLSNKKMFVLSGLIFFILASSGCWLRTDRIINSINPRAITYSIENFIGVFSWNRNFINTGRLSPDLIDAYRYVYDNVETEDGCLFVGDEYFCAWDTISHSNGKWNNNLNKVKEQATNCSHIECITVQKGYNSDFDNWALNIGDVVFENETTYIIHLSNR